MRFVADSKVSTYLREAGGNTREGDKPREFVLRADGTVLSRVQVGRFDRLLLYPGDTVVVPARLKPGFNLYDLLAYTQLTSSFALTAVRRSRAELEQVSRMGRGLETECVSVRVHPCAGIAVASTMKGVDSLSLSAWCILHAPGFC